MYVINDLLGDTALASTGLSKLKSAFAVFKNQQQKYPLVYESKIRLIYLSDEMEC